MKVIKFTLNEDYYNAFRDICVRDGIAIKSKINVLLVQDRNPNDFKESFPADHHEKTKGVTLKINEELYKGIMKNCGRYDIRPRKYVPYLIYKYLKSVMPEMFAAAELAMSNKVRVDMEASTSDDIDDEFETEE